MRVLVLGDIHGRKIWKQIIALIENYDAIIFVGDYFDTKENISFENQLRNFLEILEFKRKYPDKVFLLCGNHDLHYLDIPQSYSGYQNFHAKEIYSVLNTLLWNNELLACKIIDNILISHAGVTKTWCENWKIKIDKDLEDSINILFQSRPFSMCFQGDDIYGNDITQSPMWVRPQSLILDKVDNYNHIVGHTYQEKMSFDRGVFFIDTLGSSGEILEIDSSTIEHKIINLIKREN